MFFESLPLWVQVHLALTGMMFLTAFLYVIYVPEHAKAKVVECESKFWRGVILVVIGGLMPHSILVVTVLARIGVFPVYKPPQDVNSDDHANDALTSTPN